MKISIIPFIFLLFGCSITLPENALLMETTASIYPDYADITIPPNIAPLCFEILGDYDQYITQLLTSKGYILTIKGKRVVFSLKKWKKVLTESAGEELKMKIFVKKANQWYRFPDIINFVASEPIDPYVSYRLIEPLDESWGKMGLYQRNIETFAEKEIIHNRLLGSQCINCHSFQNYRTNNMMFHIRGTEGRTVFVSNGQPRHVQTRSKEGYAAAVYPSWHPSLPLIAFSTNTTGQIFHSLNKNLVEVIDFRSDLLLYHVETKQLNPIIQTDDAFETYPYWSPDGKHLYYCVARSPVARTDYDRPERKISIIDSFARIRYDILRLPFDASDLSFGAPDTVFHASAMSKSATLPRISPDGKYLLMTVGNYGNFHIWHKESDLFLLDLHTGNYRIMDEINSNEAESYHSWSSNGRWIIFSSRRDDGAFTRLYLTYFDQEGKARKPFVLPQRNPLYYLELFKSYNIPEFTVEPVMLSPRQFLNY